RLDQDARVLEAERGRCRQGGGRSLRIPAARLGQPHRDAPVAAAEKEVSEKLERSNKEARTFIRGVRPCCIPQAVALVRSAWRLPWERRRPACFLPCRLPTSPTSRRAKRRHTRPVRSLLRLLSTTVPSPTCCWARSREQASRRPVCSICWTGRASRRPSL